MALTIPTAELTGLLNDVLPFVPATKDDPYRGVLIAWDNDSAELSASAYDVLSGARSTWVYGEGQEGDHDEEHAEANGIVYGPRDDDPSWQVFISADDAREIVKVFKLPAKRWWVPLTVKVSPTGARLTVERTGDHGPTEALQSVRTVELVAGFPNIVGITERFQRGLTDLAAMAPERSHITFSPYRLAAFGAVRAHGALELTFTDGPTVARMGERFVGFIFPNNARKGDAQAVAASAGIDPTRAAQHPGHPLHGLLTGNDSE